MIKQLQVYKLFCQDCKTLLSIRGMLASLVSNENIKLFSSDIMTHQITFSTVAHPFDLCNCKIRDTMCRKCNSVVGYHVLNPCEQCKYLSFLSHHWIFIKVKAEKLDNLYWDQLTEIIKFNNLPVIISSTISDHQICPICLFLIEEPCTIKCGHTFCKNCIYQKIMMKQECPIDQLKACIKDIILNHYASDSINQIWIYCRYSCRLQMTQWIVKGSEEIDCCQEKVKFGERSKHEDKCLFQGLDFLNNQ